jgi:hypothetical protein
MTRCAWKRPGSWPNSARDPDRSGKINHGSATPVPVQVAADIEADLDARARADHVLRSVSEEQGLPIGHDGVIALTRSSMVMLDCARRKG